MCGLPITLLSKAKITAGGMVSDSLTWFGCMTPNRSTRKCYWSAPEGSLPGSQKVRYPLLITFSVSLIGTVGHHAANSSDATTGTGTKHTTKTELSQVVYRQSLSGNAECNTQHSFLTRALWKNPFPIHREPSHQASRSHLPLRSDDCAKNVRLKTTDVYSALSTK